MVEKNRDVIEGTPATDRAPETEDVSATEGADGVVGAAAGLASGAFFGGLLGLATGGPVGAVVGAGLGTLAGAAAGYVIDYDTHTEEFHRHHAAEHPQGRHTWDQASPAYRYGWDAHDRPEFRDKTYDHIRADVQKGWTGSGDFADYEPYVKHAWGRRSALMQDGSTAPTVKE